MITDAFDIKTDAVFGPENFYGEKKHLCDICIITFSDLIWNYMIESFEHEYVGTIKCANGVTPAYIFNIEGMKIAGYLSHIGSAMAATDVIDVHWFTGSTKFIMFGSAGSLDSDVTTGKFVIPTEAYREEGMSYQYAAPTDYIEIKNAKSMLSIFEELKLPYVLGKVWTTDAFYRETKGKLKARKNEGCIAVEMELSGVQAVCNFYGLDLYDFLVTGDVLDEAAYDYAGLGNANHDMNKLFIAIEVAKKI
ncbi:MAG TPA: nucleoside phosphorylase [Lachnospiraceae bacterium]|nr:nucleoside phosphorylase [Lachnospiraceae bacterium]